MSADDRFSGSYTGGAVDELIVRVLQGAASEADERLLDAWRNASPANDRYFRETERVWALGEGLRPVSRASEPSRAPTVHELTWRAQARSRRSSPPSARPGSRRRRIALAAAVVLGLFGTSQVLMRELADSGADAEVEYVARGAETRTVTLGDGTIVLLTPESRLRVADGEAGPGPRGPNVWLDGRAYFAVPPRVPGRRFRVRTHAGDAVVLGTRFDLDVRDDRMRLLVVEGEVELAAGDRTLAVTANQVGRLGDAGAPVRETVDTSYVQRELRWMRDYLVFNETPFDQVAHELTRYYGVRVELLDPSLAEQTVHGWFANEALEDVLPIICRAVEARCDIGADRVTITAQRGGQP